MYEYLTGKIIINNYNNIYFGPRAYSGGGKGGSAPPQNSELSHFSNLKLESEENKKISLLFIQCTKKIVYVNQSHHDRSLNENLSRMYIHPNRMGAIRDSKVKQLFLNAKPQSLEFGLGVVKDHLKKFYSDLI